MIIKIVIECKNWRFCVEIKIWNFQDYTLTYCTYLLKCKHWNEEDIKVLISFHEMLIPRFFSRTLLRIWKTTETRLIYNEEIQKKINQFKIIMRSITVVVEGLYLWTQTNSFRIHNPAWKLYKCFSKNLFILSVSLYPWFPENVNLFLC